MSVEKENKQWVFVTSHLAHHGMAFFEKILISLINKPIYFGNLEKPAVKKRSQIEFLKSYSFPSCLEGSIYILPSNFPGSSEYYNPRLKWDILESSLKRQGQEQNSESDLVERFKELLPLTKGRIKTDLINKAEQSWEPEQMHDLWQILHELPVQQQYDWFLNYSVFKDHLDIIDLSSWDPSLISFEKKIKIVKMNIIKGNQNHDDYLVETSQNIDYLIKYLPAELKYGINTMGLSTTDHLVWRYLKPLNINLKNSFFFRVPTEKSEKSKYRFRDFSFESTVQSLSRKPVTEEFETHWCKERKNAKNLLQKYIGFGDLFPIVVFGPRGSGKSSLIRKVYKTRPDAFFETNCSAIPAQLAESILFGHIKGAFTGADVDNPGLLGKLFEYFKSTKDPGILFLDEFHHLPKEIQQKLLTTLQTDENGFFSYTKMGEFKEKKLKFQLIVGTNRSLEELISGRDGNEPPLYRDFLDRVLQRIVTLPPLQKDELEGSWNEIWNKFKFAGITLNPLESMKDEFVAFLNSFSYPGNFRDLERIAICTSDTIRLKENEGYLTNSDLTEMKDNLQYLNWDKETLGSNHSSTPETSSNEQEKSLNFLCWANGGNLSYNSKEAKHIFTKVRQIYAKAVLKQFINQSRASKETGINQKTLSRWLNQMEKE